MLPFVLEMIPDSISSNADRLISSANSSAKRKRTAISLNKKMSDSGSEVLINGRPLSALRLVELKEELQKRGLPRSGNKTQLIEKLKKVRLSLSPVRNHSKINSIFF
jgi:hypothetical protein